MAKKGNAGSFGQAGRKGGRPAGVPNKATQNAREAIAAFVDGNAERLQGWLDKIEQEDGPQAAFRCVMDLMEYHVPKLARTEVTGKDGGPVSTVVNHIYEEGGK